MKKLARWGLFFLMAAGAGLAGAETIATPEQEATMKAGHADAGQGRPVEGLGLLHRVAGFAR